MNPADMPMWFRIAFAVCFWVFVLPLLMYALLLFFRVLP